jgi:cysteine-rich repeat protein
VHKQHVPKIAAALAAAIAVSQPSAASAQGLPARFVEEPVFTGLTDPTAVRFHPDGRVFVAEKRGVVRVYDSLEDTTPTTFVDLSDRVNSYWDRGLLGLALHPDFAAQPYVYVLYTLDAQLGAAPPSWNDDCPDPPGGTTHGCVVQARLSRFRAEGNVASGAEEVLIQDWCQQYPSHSIGALQFAADGALYVSAGDGADFGIVDYGQRGQPLNACGDPPVAAGGVQLPPSAEGGALRAQDLRTAGDPVGLGGTILRVDPLTGGSLADNPLHGGADASDDRIIAFGLRNPFRFAPRPGTREVWIGDVGWNDWEEIDIVADATDATIENFGWPCYEGSGKQPGYDAADLALCESLYAVPAQHTAPHYEYDHHGTVLDGDGCTSAPGAISGLAFYDGGSFPAEYDGALFFADYGRNCIWAMLPDASGRPVPANRRAFRAGAGAPVDLLVGPGGALYYVSLESNSVLRIRYSNDQPFAQIAASPLDGPAPLEVHFDGSASTDPNGDALRYGWDFDGDGAFDDASEAAPVHTFAVDGSMTVRLRVTDPAGLFDDASVVIDVANTAPVAAVDAPLATTTWRVGDVIAFSGHADDAEQGLLPAAALSWEVVILHCATAGDCHDHVATAVSGVASGTFTAPDHPYPSQIELRMTATDALGRTGTAAIAIQPETALLELTSEPAAFSLAIDGTTQSSPISVQAIVGSAHSVSALSPQQLDGVSHDFVAWSDEGEASHLVTVAPGGTALHATFAPSCGNGVVQDGEACDDGNVSAGDCCAPDCTFEPESSACGDDGDACTSDACDGAGGCVHAPTSPCPLDGGITTDGGSDSGPEAGSDGAISDAGGAGEGNAAGAGAGAGGAGAAGDAGGNAGTGASPGAGRGGAGGMAGDADRDGGAAAESVGSSDDGCDCAVPGAPRHAGSSRGWLIALVVASLLWSRKRR